MSVLVGSKIASSLGIILNEFASNSVKHAFPAGRPGHLRFDLTWTAPDVARLVCQDNGVGMGASAAGRVGLGLQIVQSMVARIDAEVATISGPQGTQTTVTFKPE